MHYGQVLKEAAQAQGLNNMQIAFKAGTAIGSVNVVLAGSDAVNLNTVKKIARVLGYEVSDIEIREAKSNGKSRRD